MSPPTRFLDYKHVGDARLRLHVFEPAGHDRVRDDHVRFSPLHNIRAGQPPALLMLGTRDDFIPVATLERFATESRAFGNRCELLLYEGQPHGFFNYGDGQNPFHAQTLNAADAFLVSTGFLPAPG